MKAKILFVDDEQNVLDAFKRHLRGRYVMDTANSGREGLELLKTKGPYAVVVSDMRMPEMNGVEFLSRVKKQAPETIRLMLTGNADQETAVKAVNEGNVYQFLTKPCPASALEQALQESIQQYQLVRAEKELLAKTLNGCIRILTDILSTAAPEAFSKSQRLKEIINSFAPILKGQNSWELELAAMLSSIGYVALPSETMEKRRAKRELTGPEKDMMTRLPETSSRLIESIPRLEKVARIILYQNKNFDGSGFPIDDLSGKNIPSSARKLKIVSDLATLEIKGFNRLAALKKMKALSGRYDESLLDDLIAHALDVTKESVSKDMLVPFAELRVGDLLVTNIEATGELLLIPKGVELTELALVKLRNMTHMLTIKEPICIKRLLTDSSN